LTLCLCKSLLELFLELFKTQTLSDFSLFRLLDTIVFGTMHTVWCMFAFFFSTSLRIQLLNRAGVLA